ncbi:MAG TPA: GntR family transcriptional regulator [Alphaproteobacteria bacterium]|nr:GntR family transcriptional regulator [Alphaproteobacteria bacterium]
MAQPQSKATSTSVVDYIAESILKGIHEGRYAPGQRLVEADITQELGVSRGPLREAFRRLAADGILEIQAHKGAAIRRHSRAELRELFRVREVLEGLAARLAAERIEMPGARERALATWQRLRDVGPSLEVPDVIEDNESFHGTIFELSGNRFLQRVMTPLQMPTYRAAFFRLFRSANRQRSLAQHIAILEAVLDGNPDRAEAEMRNHVRETEELSRNLSDILFRPEIGG